MKEMNQFFSIAAGTPAVTSAQMKEIERKADEAGLSYYQMMENAGTGAAEYIDSQFPVLGKKVLIFCGKGNNGGDGFVVALKFQEKGAEVKLILTEGEPKTPDAQTNYKICQTMNIPMIEISEMPEGNLENTDLIVDAIYGTGFHGSLRESGRAAARMINRSGVKIYALDIPSGLNGDTGEADEDTIRAEETIAFHRMKPAHTMEGCGLYCGRTVCISIGIETVLRE